MKDNKRAEKPNKESYEHLWCGSVLLYKLTFSFIAVRV